MASKINFDIPIWASIDYLSALLKQYNILWNVMDVKLTDLKATVL